MNTAGSHPVLIKPAFSKRFLKIFLHCIYGIIFIEIAAHSKMQVQTPVIQVDCPNHGLFSSSAYEHFGMDKAGRIFINLHTGAQQLRIIGSCQKDRHRVYREYEA